MGGTGDYQSTTEASNRWRTYPNNFVYSGYVCDSTVYNRNSNGGYWSSSGSYIDDAYYMYFSSAYANSGTNGSYKSYGRMVRCVAGV